MPVSRLIVARHTVLMEAEPVSMTNSSSIPPVRVTAPKNLKRVEASKRAAAAHKAAREKDAKILEQLQASKKELQQPPDNTNSKTDWTLWIVGGIYYIGCRLVWLLAILI